MRRETGHGPGETVAWMMPSFLRPRQESDGSSGGLWFRPVRLQGLCRVDARAVVQIRASEDGSELRCPLSRCLQSQCRV
jgi:hypothetical protein